MPHANYYEVVAVSYELRKRMVIASDLTDDESDRVRRKYIEKNGLTAYIGGKRVPVQLHIYRQHHAHKEFNEDHMEVIRQ